MIEGTRLLERIRNMERAPADRKPMDEESQQQSVLRHLVKLLNTRQGSTLLASDYGVPDYTSLTTTPNAENLATIEKSIRDVVQRYEPRLENVQVKFAEDPDDPLKMGFTLTGGLTGSENDTRVSFRTVLAPTGKITIRRVGGEE